MTEATPTCGKCGKPKTAQRTGTVSYWLCVPCYKASAPLEPEYRAVETFPRPPSNEQTLLTELGEAKARCLKLQAFKDWVHAYLDTHGVPHHPPGPHGAEGCRIGDRMDWLMGQQAELRAIDERMCADYSTMVEQLAEASAERDALAVAAEQYNEGIDNWIKRSYAQDEQILGLQAERDTARSEVKRLTEIITGWRAEYDHKENVTREQIARLRESLEWAFGETNRDENYFLNGSKVAAVCAILKETAP